MMRCATVSLVLFLLLAPFSARAEWSGPSVVCTISDARANELSGLAVSRRVSGIYYAHNDSGDTARVFALDKSGVIRAEILVENAEAVDWEDMAAATGPDGAPTLFVADTGDNLRKRETCVIYSFPEPRVTSDQTPTVTRVRARALRFRYPGGPRDCETLMVDPRDHALYLVEKVGTTPSGVFRLRPDWEGGIQTAERIGEARFSDPLPLWPNLATGGDIAPNGGRFVIRTYQQAYEWRIPKDGDIAEALKADPLVLPLQGELQGEAICYGSNSRAWLTVAEGTPTVVRMYTWSDESRRTP